MTVDGHIGYKLLLFGIGFARSLFNTKKKKKISLKCPFLYLTDVCVVYFSTRLNDHIIWSARLTENSHVSATTIHDTIVHVVVLHGRQHFDFIELRLLLLLLIDHVAVYGYGRRVRLVRGVRLKIKLNLEKKFN